ncbi:hypothetical protein ACFY84_08735 [Streptomyces sp. NPDC012438]|uniref:hypothetical protein n=1 Tax=Streptomyces sp. NPDC012438 TaxID=3364833 RepID=UPI0036EF4CD3
MAGWSADGGTASDGRARKHGERHVDDPGSGTDGRRTARRRSDLAALTARWRGLGGDGFLALPPPPRSRFTQSDGHKDAAELAAVRGLPAPVSFAY